MNTSIRKVTVSNTMEAQKYSAIIRIESNYGLLSKQFKKCVFIMIMFPVLFIMTARAQSTGQIPVVYCSDLFHPHQDPDDHLDLATLFSMSEFDVKAILLDQGKKQENQPGSIPVRQMLTLTGKKVPFASGLATPLKSETDTGEDQDIKYQGAVKLFLKTLEQSSKPVQVFVVGSLRDVVAAFNRNPQLVKAKVAMFHINAGRAALGKMEWNVLLDRKAYKRMLESGLPISLYPCVPLNDPKSSHWTLKHYGDVFKTAPLALQNYIIYALSTVDTAEIDPQDALKMNLRPFARPIYDREKNMWCQASFITAAGRKIYKFGDEWKALPPTSGGQTEDTLFTMVPLRMEVDEKGNTSVLDYQSPNPNVLSIVQKKPEQYQLAMTSCLKYIYQEFQVNMKTPVSKNKKGKIAK